MPIIERTPNPDDPKLLEEIRRRQKLYAELISVLACPTDVQIAVLEKMR